MTERSFVPYVALLLMSWWILYGLAALLDPVTFALSFELGADNAVLVEMGAKVDPLVARGEVHRLVVSAFLHSGPIHLVANTAWLLVLAWLCRRLKMTGIDFIIYFLVGAVGGQVASFGFSMGPSVGASGGIYSLLGVLLVESWRVGVEPRLRVIGCVAMGLVLGMPFLFGSVDHAAHFGGFIVGTLAALVALKAQGHRLPFCFSTVFLCLSCFAPFSPQADLPIPEIQPGVGEFSMRACVGLEARHSAPCVREPSVLFVALLSLDDLAALEPNAMETLPSVGKEVHYSARGQTLVMHRPTENRVFVIATDSGLWPRFQSSIEDLSAVRFPDI